MTEPTLPRAALRPDAGRRPPPVVALCAAAVVGCFLLAVLGGLIAPHDPGADNLHAVLEPPSTAHWLGTDDAGRDVFSRLVVGTRQAVVGPVVVVVLSATIGLLLGLLAGYRGGAYDAVIMRGADLLSALPALLVAVVLTGVLGGGYVVAVVVTCLLVVAMDTRVVRGAALDIRQKDYIAAATTLGLSRWRIMTRHMLPNLVGLLLANMLVNLANVLVVLAALSFLGLGIAPGTADWGRMLAENLPVVQTQPWAAIAPGAALVIFAVSMNTVGDWLYDVLEDRGRS